MSCSRGTVPQPRLSPSCLCKANVRARSGFGHALVLKNAKLLVGSVLGPVVSWRGGDQSILCWYKASCSSLSLRSHCKSSMRSASRQLCPSQAATRHVATAGSPARSPVFCFKQLLEVDRRPSAYALPMKKRHCGGSIAWRLPKSLRRRRSRNSLCPPQGCGRCSRCGRRRLKLPRGPRSPSCIRNWGNGDSQRKPCCYRPG
mmetsp:Transcript_56974/g.117868  ORF Transcript_56974/g.117868 Transcript_56974/m.117868 type:complete len:202 (-) Transcript_56974:595-1200(-)